MASEFGTVLRRLRVREGLTQDELERRSGVSVSTIRGLETGKRTNPRMTTVQQLADALALGSEDREELMSAAVPGPREPGSEELGSEEPGSEEPGSEQSPPEVPTPERPTWEQPTPEAPTPEKPASAAPDPLADATEQLAKAVAARWQREEEQRQIQDPYPLPVRWKVADEGLIDHWANIRRLPPGAANDPLDLSGRLEQIAERYRDIPSRRLVVLGRSGSGKTILTLRFVLDHVKTRTPDEPVPVIFSIGAWNPTAITLRDWLTEQLMRDHPGTAARGPGRANLASALVDSGRVLPVLDGFDEIADRLRRPALEALNATTLPLLLTSRPDEYAAAVDETDVLTAAAALELTDLTLDDLAAYLPRTTRKSNPANPDEGAWDPVLRELRELGELKALREPGELKAPREPGELKAPREPGEQPADGPASPLATVLTTPLMVSLARTVYSDTPDHDPATLLDTQRFGTPEALEDHLLDNFLPTVYRHRHGHRPEHGPRDCDPDRARRWLGYLADHLNRQKTPDLAWWRLGNVPRRSTRTLVTAVMTGLVVGLVDCAVAFAVGGSFPFPIVDATAVGLLSGLMFGIAYWLMFAAKDMPVMPSAMRLHIGGRPGSMQWKAHWETGSGSRHMIGLLGGLVFGCGYGFVVGLVNAFQWKLGLSAGLHMGLIDGIVFGLVFCAATGFTFCLLGLLETPLDIRSAVNPRSLLIANRRSTITQLLLGAPIFGAVVGVGGGIVVDLLQGPLGPLLWSPTAGLVLGIISGLCGALGYVLTLTAWGQWIVLARIWLPLTGRLPWAVVTFLEDAYQRGVLRQAGAVYQFRHARLQHHLAQRHRRSGFHDDFIAPP